MIRKNIVYLGVTAILVMVLFSVVNSCSTKETETAQESMQEAQLSAGPVDPLGFTLKHVNGEKYDMKSLNGKVVIVDFWDTWCPPCRAIIPDLIKLKEKYKDKDFEIIGIAFGRDGFETVQKFTKDYKINYPVLIMDEENSKKIFEAYGAIQYIPTAFILDKKGKIVDKLVGGHPINEYEKRVKPLM